MTDPGSAIIHAAASSSAAAVFIQKCADAIGGLARPWQTIRVAEAEGKAAIIRAESDLEIEELSLRHRAVSRFVAEEAKRQHNMESIAQQSVPLLEPSADPSAMNDDWITKFFNEARLISDPEMQQLWARILAGEANVPGKVGRRTLSVLASLDHADAKAFQEITNRVWLVGEDPAPIPVILVEISKAGQPSPTLDLEALANLETAGLIKLDSTTGFSLMITGVPIRARHKSREFILTPGRRVDPPEIPCGQLILTRAGRDILNVCPAPDAVVSEPYIEAIKQYWTDADVTVANA